MPGISTIESRPDPESHRRWNLRNNYLIPIYVMWTRDVPQPEAVAGVLGVRDTVRASGQARKVVVLGSEPFGQGEYSSPDWYIKEAYQNQSLRRDAGYGPQLDVNQVMRLFYQEHWQSQPHWEVFIVNHDLNDQDENGFLNFVFGSTNSEFGASVQSLTRLLADISNPELRAGMVRRLLRHETGHMFGLVSRGYNYEQKLGRHCASDICTMNQGMSIPEWAQQTRNEERTGNHFCADCQGELNRSRDKYLPLT